MTLTVAEVKRSVAYYQRMFGLPMQTAQGPTPVLGVGPAGGPLHPALGFNAGPKPEINHVCLGVAGFDPARIMTRLHEFGLSSAESFLPKDPLTATIRWRQARNNGGGPDAPLGTPRALFQRPGRDHPAVAGRKLLRRVRISRERLQDLNGRNARTGGTFHKGDAYGEDPLPTAEIDRPAPGSTALVIIDMINDLEGAKDLRGPAEVAARAIERLRADADRLGVPVVYVNDNFGQWHSEQSRLVEHVERSEGGELARRLAPRKDDFFVIKPQFSGFYSTNLPVLLPKLRASRLVLTGVAADICVLFTAADAHMRDYQLWTPADAVASSSDQHARWALEIMRSSMGAEIRPTDEFSLAEWVHKGERA